MQYFLCLVKHFMWNNVNKDYYYYYFNIPLKVLNVIIIRPLPYRKKVPKVVSTLLIIILVINCYHLFFVRLLLFVTTHRILENSRLKRISCSQNEKTLWRRVNNTPLPIRLFLKLQSKPSIHTLGPPRRNHK